MILINLESIGSKKLENPDPMGCNICTSIDDLRTTNIGIIRSTIFYKCNSTRTHRVEPVGSGPGPGLKILFSPGPGPKKFNRPGPGRVRVQKSLISRVRVRKFLDPTGSTIGSGKTLLIIQ
jgi:hypothetical protein